MNRTRTLALAATAAALAVTTALSATAHAQNVVLSVGHADVISVHYADNELFLQVKDDTGSSTVYRDPADVTLQVLPEAETAVPSNPDYAFLGDPGDPVWVLPQVQDHDLLWPGWNTESLSASDFISNTVTLSLVGVSGPGDVALWFSQLGGPQVAFNSGNGLPDALQILIGTHAHVNWGFTAAGDYTLQWRVDATLANGTPVSTGVVDYRWTVG